MKKLCINRLDYHITTYDNSTYGASIPFNKGLNIIFGPNSVGKSSIICGIIYGLGGEKSLGIFRNLQNPFKPEFYIRIDGKRIKDSFLLLEISNYEKKITIRRNIIGKTNVAIIKECSIDDFDITMKSQSFIIEGEGVMENMGFQKYIFDFLGWNIIEVPKHDGTISKLYFENLLPLFFIEQQVGWSQIQARQITRYRIKDIKKVSFEYLMGLDKFDIHLTCLSAISVTRFEGL